MEPAGDGQQPDPATAPKPTLPRKVYQVLSGIAPRVAQLLKVAWVTIKGVKKLYQKYKEWRARREQKELELLGQNQSERDELTEPKPECDDILIRIQEE